MEAAVAAAATPRPAGLLPRNSGLGRGCSLGQCNLERKTACLAAVGRVIAYFPGGTSPRRCFRHTLGKAAAEAAAAGRSTPSPPAAAVHSAGPLGCDVCNSPGVMNLAKKSAGSSAGCRGNHTFRERTAWPGVVIYGEKQRDKPIQMTASFPPLPLPLLIYFCQDCFFLTP